MTSEHADQISSTLQSTSTVISTGRDGVRQGDGLSLWCDYSDEDGVWKCWAEITSVYHQGAVSIRKTVLPGMAIPMLKIRRPNGRLIFNMEIAIRR